MGCFGSSGCDCYSQSWRYDPDDPSPWYIPPTPSSFHQTHLTHAQATAIPAPAHSSQAAPPPSLPVSPTSTAAPTTSSSTCTNTSTRITPAPRPPAPPTASAALSNHSSIGSKIRIARPCSLRREVAAIARAV